MVKIGETVILTFEELEIFGRKLIVQTIEQLKDDENMNNNDVRKDLNIGLTSFVNLMSSQNRPPMVGPPKKRTIKRSEFELWKSKHWGKY